jgi:hypothetical protein
VHTIRTIAAVAVASGVAVASLAGPAAAKPAPTTKSPAAAAAGYLVRNFTGKHHDHLVDLVGTKKYADYGETADAVLSLDAAGVAQSAAARATKYLQAHADAYALEGYPAPDYYPGNVAKLLLVAEAQHVNPEAFGSLDLLGALVGDEGAAGAAPGQYQNPGDTKYGSSVLIQSLAVLALANSVDFASQPPAEAVSFLAGQQCTNGAFEYSVRTDVTKDCPAGSDDVDTTSYAIQALIAAGDRGAAATALAWLHSVENHDGGWAESGGASDANSTAIAVEALVAAHRSATAGEKWLAAAQLGCASSAPKRGAVSYQGKYAAATAVRATSQAGVALAGKALVTVDKNGARAATPVLKCPKKDKK